MTLQAVAHVIVHSLNELSDHGLPIPGVADGPVTWLKTVSIIVHHLFMGFLKELSLFCNPSCMCVFRTQDYSFTA